MWPRYVTGHARGGRRRSPCWSPPSPGWIHKSEREPSREESKQASPFAYLPHATDSRATVDSEPFSEGSLVVCTGGAGGFMEAANRGASDVPGGRSIGMGISLPFETGLSLKRAPTR